MIGTRHEEYGPSTNGLPFVLHTQLERTYYRRSAENNWHENLEIQRCTGGCGTVLLDGEPYDFRPDDIIVVNSNVIHYTGTDTHLTYDCLIVSTDFCQRVDLDPQRHTFSPQIRSQGLADLLRTLTETYTDPSAVCRTAKCHEIALRILIELAEHHLARKADAAPPVKHFETVKAAISYIRTHYTRKLTLDEIAKAALCDKYELCRAFKRLTGRTIVAYVNNYRCIKAIACLREGHTVAQTAALCGFEHLSFFTKTFKTYIGKLPSDYKTGSPVE